MGPKKVKVKSLDFDDLSANRSALYAHIQSLGEQIDQKINLPVADIESLQGFLDHIEYNLEQIKSLNASVQGHLTGQDLVDEVRDSQNQLQLIMQYKAKLKVKLKVQQEFSSGSRPTVGIVKNNINIPRIELPTFDGDLGSWVSFIDTFLAVIDRNTNLQEVEKLIYLKSCLIGEPKNLVESLGNTNSNYKIAIDILYRRYNDKELLINAAMKNLLHLPSAHGSLRHFYNIVEQNVASLTNLGVSPDQYEAMLKSILMEKIPRDIKDNIFYALSDIHLTYRNIMNEFLKIINARDRSGNFDKSGGSQLGVNAAQAVAEKQKGCVFCDKESHPNWKCQKQINVKEKFKIVKSNGICVRCLGKHQNECWFRKCSHCQGDHHLKLCFKKAKSERAQAAASLSKPRDDVPGSNHNKATMSPKVKDNFIEGGSNLVTSNAISTSCNSVMQTALAKIECKVKSEFLKVRIFFDKGANRSFIVKYLSDKCKFPVIRKEELSIAKFGNQVRDIDTFDVVKLELINGVNKRFPLEAIVVERVVHPIDYTVYNKVSDYEHLRYLDLADNDPSWDEGEVHILVGCDYYWNFVSGDVIKGRNSPSAMNSVFGWLLSGPNPNAIVGCAFVNRVDDVTALSLQAGVRDREFQDKVEKFFQIETICVDQVEHDKTLEDFQRNIKFVDGRYEVKLPWANNGLKLADNFFQAKIRLNALLKRLKKDKNLLIEYNKVIVEQLERGFIERVDEDIMKGDSHYIPHHAILKEESLTTKVRIVLDGSCKPSRNLPSLNQCLENGPNMIEDLVDVLNRFRLGRIGISSDLEKAFLMIQIAVEDRDRARFLWPVDPFTYEPGQKLQIFRFCRVFFGCRSSPFLLSATLDYHLRREEPQALALEILKCLYVDNLLVARDGLAEAFKVCNEAHKMFKRAGFNLREFATNSRELKDLLKGFELNKNSSVKVLGLEWDTETDRLQLHPVKKSSTIVSKRTMLQELASVYDPLGWVTPYLLLGKCMVQAMWLKQCDWDEEVSADWATQWNHWKSELPDLGLVNMSRYHFDTDGVTSLHVFADASMSGYAAVLYVVSSDGVSLLMAKGRVAPTKKQTIPRLELLAIVLAAELLNKFLVTFHKDVDLVLWSDSTICLNWLNNPPKTVFVRNRIKKIKELLPNARFFHCISEDNPADIGSRGCCIKDLLVTKLWWHGPSWLVLSEELWPENRDSYSKIVIFEPRESEIYVSFAEEYFGIGRLINASRFSCWFKLCRVTALVFRAVERFKGKFRVSFVNSIPAEELLQMQLLWLRFAQNQEFSEIFQGLKKGNSGVCFGKIKSLGIFLDTTDQLIRCKGRLQNADLLEESKHPILLPAKSVITELIIFDVHKNNKHAGIQHTLILLKAKFWIIKFRQTVARNLNRCAACKRYKALPYQYPQPPDLPVGRVATRAFVMVGVDYAGPLYLRNNSKVYIILFSCASTRAVHLELVSDMTAETFINALLRFSARRRAPGVIVSDNAQQFKSTAKAVSEISRLSSIRWTFIPARSPWFGGFYERMVAEVKKHLRITMGSARLNFDDLNTAVTEVEGIVNSRPISYSPSEFGVVALTPNQLIYGEDLHQIPDHVQPVQHSSSELVEAVSHKQKVLERFWDRWKSDYLTSLREFRKSKKGGSKQIQVGDVVIIHQEGPRQLWKLGIVKNLCLSEDDQVRSALVDTTSGTLSRCISLLYPLEISIEEITQDVSGNCQEESIVLREPSSRLAALEAKQKIKDCSKFLRAPSVTE